MASVFDILGTVLSVLSLLGCLNSLYRFLKNRQPSAQSELFEVALRDAYKRIDELEQYGYLSEDSDPNLSAVYRSALARIDREILQVRAQAKRHRPNSVVAVLIYSYRYGVKSALARRIGASTKLIRDIRYQLDFPLENPYINYSGLVPNNPKIVYDEAGRSRSIWRPGITDEVKSAVTGTQLYRSTEGLKYRNISWTSDPPVDADIASQMFAIRARRMQRIQARLDALAPSILKRSEHVRNFPSNVIGLNRLLMIERGLLPPEDSLVGARDPDLSATEASGDSGGLEMEIYQETMAAQHEAALREMHELQEQFQSILDSEYADFKIQCDQIAAKMRRRPDVGASRETNNDAPTAVMASGVSTTSITRSHQD